MPDISMCKGVGCDKKETCYRFMAIPSSRQSMAEFYNKDTECEYFIPIEKGDKIRDDK